ncbi:MAG: hypothetical protein IJF48_04075, partial [Clostridia bacterium]|nr:hypothetical protein [Clostridia bacterium]
PLCRSTNEFQLNKKLPKQIYKNVFLFHTAIFQLSLPLSRKSNKVKDFAKIAGFARSPDANRL